MNEETESDEDNPVTDEVEDSVTEATEPGHNNSTNGSISKKRTYKFVNRISNPRKKSKLRENWEMDLQSMSDITIRSTVCCKKKKRFSSVNVPFMRDYVQQLLTSSFRERKERLLSMKGSNGKFTFDGNIVCNMFLKKAFRYGTDLISSTRKCSTTLTNVATNNQSSSTMSSFTSYRASPSRDSIVSFLQRLADDTGDRMPDRDEQHIPYFSKKEVYEAFIEDFKNLYNGNDPPKLHYFAAIWKQHCHHIKIRRVHRFAACSICEELKGDLRDAVSKGICTEDLKRQKRGHNDHILNERIHYQMKRDIAMAHPDRYCSIILDGADQSAFGLPHFVTETKSVRGHSMKVRLVGILEHCRINCLRLYTMTEEYKTGANHIIESIHRFLIAKLLVGDIAPTFYVQVDNCSRENKNRYAMSYLEFLVARNVFDVVEVSFLPVGHTHEDIDQAFSCTPCRLKVNNAITLHDLHHEFKQCYNESTTVGHMKRVVNWSGMCEEQKCIRGVTNFTHFRYFKFVRSTQTQEMEGPGVCCLVKENAGDAWTQLPVPGRLDNVGFLKSVPNLNIIPNTNITCPPNIGEINNRIDTKQTRIRNVSKVGDLKALRNYIYHTRSEKFHWSIESSPEFSGGKRISGHAPHDNSDDDFTCDDSDEESVGDIEPVPPPPSVPSTRSVVGLVDNSVSNIGTHQESATSFEYGKGSFVAVRADVGSRISFWIACVLDVKRDSAGTAVCSLLVHWYNKENVDGADRDSRYSPCYVNPRSERRRLTGKVVR